MNINKHDSRTPTEPIEIASVCEPEPQHDEYICSHGHFMIDHLNCLEAERFLNQELFINFYLAHRPLILAKLRQCTLAELILFCRYSHYDDIYLGVQELIRYIHPPGHRLIRITAPNTFQGCLDLSRTTDWKTRNTAAENMMFTCPIPGVLILRTEHNTRVIHINYLSDQVTIEPQGTGISAMKTVATGVFESCKTTITQVVHAIRKFFEKVTNMFTHIVDKIRMRVKSYLFTRILEILEEIIGTNPMLVMSIVSTTIALLTSTGVKDVILSSVSLAGMLATMVKAATNTQHALGLDSLKMEFKDLATNDEIEQAYNTLGEEAKERSLTDTITEVITTIVATHTEDLEEEEELDETNPFREETAIDKHGIKGTTLLEIIGSVFGFSSTIIKTASKIGFAGMRDYNTLCAARKNMGDMLGALGKILPEWIKTLIVVGNPKAYIHQSVNDPTTPLGLAYHAALTYWTMIRQGAVLDLCLQQKHIAQNAYTAWITYAKDKSIAMEGDFVRMNREIEKFMSATAKPTAREREPFMLRLSGDSGVGKSTLWTVLLSALPEFDKFTDEKQFKDITYVRQVGADYWDGYTNEKKILLYDDFNHAREEVDLAEMICVGSTAAYMPAMASIDVNNTHVGVKGTQFTSPYVVMLTNNRTINPTTLFSTEAINRRRTIHFHLTFKSSPHERPEGYHGNVRMARQADFSHIKFEMDYSTSGQPKLENLTLQEVRDLIRNEYDIFVERQDAIHTSINHLLQSTATVTTSRIRAHKSKIVIDQQPPAPIDFGTDSEGEDVVKHGVSTKLALFASASFATFIQLQKKAEHCLKKGCFVCFSCLRGAFYGFKLFVGNNITPIMIFFAKITMLATAAITGAGIVTWMANHRRNKEVDKHSGTNKTTKYKPEPKLIVKGGATTDIIDSVRQNTVQLTQGDNPLNYQNGLFIQGTILATTEHFFHNMDDSRDSKYVAEGTPFQIKTPFSHEVETFKFEEKRLKTVKGADGEYLDCVVYELPNTVRARRTIIHHFWDGTSNLKNRRYASVHINKHEQLSAFRGQIISDHIVANYSNGIGNNKVPVKLHRTFGYDFRGIPGDCGTPIICDDDSFQRKLIGLHIGAATTESIGMILTQQGLKKAMENMSPITREAYIEPNGYRLPTDTDVDTYDLPGKITLYGISKHIYMPPTRTTIVESPLHGMITTPTTKPAHLNMFRALGQGKDIMKIGISKYSHPNPPMDEDILHDVTEAIEKEVNFIPTVNVKRKLTMMEAINGIHDQPGLGRMNMSTSSGYPFSVDPVYAAYKGPKKNLFTRSEEDEDYEPLPVLKEMVEDCIGKLKQGVIPDLPFVDCLKDERRPLAKVDAFKTRVFSICPVAMTIVMRMYMSPYTAHMMETRHQTHIAMGINKNSLEWQRMYNRMTEYSPEACDGDAEAWDGRMHKQIMKVHYDVAHEFFDDKTQEDRLVRTGLWIYNSEATHIYFDPKTRTCALYTCNGGNPSGQGDTTPVNTTGNLATFIYAWTILAPLHLRDPIHFFRNVKVIVYGDDSIYSCKEEMQSFFTPTAIQAILAQHGMIYGPANKIGNFNGFKPFEECTFLKNSTIDFYGWKVPFMEDTAVFETLNWIRQDKNSPLPEKCCEDNCNDVLRTILFRGEKEFNTLRDNILTHKPDYKLLRFKYLREEFLTNGSLTDPFNADGFARSENNKLTIFNKETLASY